MQFLYQEVIFSKGKGKRIRQRKQNQRHNKHCNFSLEKLAAKIAFDNSVRNEGGPCLPLATNECENMFHGYTNPRCLQIFQFNHKKSVMKHSLLNLIVNPVEGKTKHIK